MKKPPPSDFVPITSLDNPRVDDSQLITHPKIETPSQPVVAKYDKDEKAISPYAKMKVAYWYLSRFETPEEALEALKLAMETDAKLRKPKKPKAPK